MDKNLNKLHRAGQYIIEDLVLSSYNGSKVNLKPNMLELVLHEDIFSNFLSGQLVILENVNLIENIPLIGQEYLTVKYKTLTRDFYSEKTFFVYKVDNKIETNQTNKIYTYTLFFVSDEFVKSQLNKLSRTFVDLKNSEIAETIYADYLQNSSNAKPFFTEKSLGTKTITFPYISPVKAIKYLCENSISDNGYDCSYLFYETMDGFFFNTITYPSSVTKNPIKKYYHFPANMSIPDILKDINIDYSRIESYQFLNMGNTIKNIANGVFSSYLILPNSTYKKYDESYHSYKENYYRVSHIDSNDVLPSSADRYSYANYSDYNMLSKQYYVYDGIIDNDAENDTYLKRKFQLKHFYNSRITFLLSGDSNRRVGEVIEINIFSGDPNKNKSSVYDKHLSGKYLITKITHIFQPQEYKMRVEACRDSVSTPYPDVSIDKDLQ